MKTLALIYILFRGFSVYADEYILYPIQDKGSAVSNYLKSTYKISSSAIFTKEELQKIELPTTITSALKIKVEAAVVNQLKNDLFLGQNIKKLERISNLKYFQSKSGEFESLQWGLRNSGNPIELKLTDIDRLSLKANVGEDVNLGSLKEVDGFKIRVAVIDSGIDINHPEFKNIIYTNIEECDAWEKYQSCLRESKEDDDLTKSCHERLSHIDTDGNGYPMDCHGWNVAAPINNLTQVQGNNDINDLVGHGTHISGIIAASQDTEGTSGIITNVEILPVKVSGSTEDIQEDNTTDIFAKGILYALKQNVDIINLSVGWSSNEDSLLVSELIKKAHSLGILVVAAGGNSSHSTETYPCSYNEVICAGSHNPDGSRSHFSNFGTSIDIFAPGHSILSTWPLEIRPKLFTQRHGYEYKNGTSFSAPFTVGVLARLLNLGYSPDEARVKLLGGARKSPLNSSAINGNVDLLGSASFSSKSFIYPYKKSSALINWHEGDKKLILKLKNYLVDATDITLKLDSRDSEIKIKEDVKKFTSWKRDEIKEITFSLDGHNDISSELKFDLKISSNDEDKSYPINAVAATVIHDNFIRADTKRISVNVNRSLEEFNFSPFLNYIPSTNSDFLVSQLVDGKLIIGLLKLDNDRYKLSRLHSTIFSKEIIIQAAKIDLDFDGTTEYVVTGMYQNKENKWVAKFYIFNENFTPSQIEICPGNEYINLITSIGTDLRWMKQNNKLVPTWISMGYSPSIDLPPSNPLSAKIVNEFKRRIYYLDNKGLRVFTPPQLTWAQFKPITFITQTKEDILEGTIKFIYTIDDGFIKSYAFSDTTNLNSPETFVLERYQNLYPIDAMTFSNTQEVVFSESDSITGVGQISTLSPGNLYTEQTDFSYPDLLDPIQLILNKTINGNYFALTKYGLLYMKENTFYKTENRNADHQIQYKRLKSLEALYLSSKYTPGLSSELIMFKDEDIIRPAKFRFLLGNECQEIGYSYSLWDEKDQINFYCNKSKKVLTISL